MHGVSLQFTWRACLFVLHVDSTGTDTKRCDGDGCKGDDLVDAGQLFQLWQGGA